ncbi:MAG: hypothetical protein ABJB97_11350 [Acidobacteriota bacterium]
MTAQQYANHVKAELNDSWLAVIYCERILSMRTRSYHFEAFGRSSRVEIHHTLLGIELKVGRRRMLCPDLPTARYLSIFARAGCTDVAVPYDITKVSQLADELESSWHRMLLLADLSAAGETPRLRSRIHGLLIAKLREEIAAAGSGPPVPHFKQTRSRAPV